MHNSPDRPIPSYVISTDKATWLSYAKDLWKFRSLIKVLAYRDWKVKYAQTALGVTWSLLQPLVTLLIFVFFFQQVIDLSQSIRYPYAVFAFSGLICWQYFSYHVNQGGASLIHATELIKKVYFPKLIVPLSKTLSGLADMGAALVALAVIMIFYQIIPGWRILALPLALVIQMLLGLSVSIWLSALTIRYRDLQHILPHLINFGIWLTPVFYPGTLIPERYAIVLYCNPAASAIEIFRWSIIPDQPFNMAYGYGLGVMIVLLISGIWYFRRTEDYISDYL